MYECEYNDKDDEKDDNFYNFFEGQFINGVKQGYGRIIFTNGDYYEGEWKDGVHEGVGKYVFFDG